MTNKKERLYSFYRSAQGLAELGLILWVLGERISVRLMRDIWLDMILPQVSTAWLLTVI
jgi:hypothetical protein